MAEKPVQLPPQALEAEMAVLGSMLIEPDAVEKAIDILTENDFYQEIHRKIYRALIELNRLGRGVDLVTAGAELSRVKALDDVGGMGYLSELSHKTSTAAYVDHYARLVKEKAILRQLINTATGVVAACFKEEKEATEILDEAQTSILKVAENQPRHGILEAKNLVHDAVEQIETAYKNKESVTGIPSGLKKFDLLTAGFQKSDLILIAARPSQGKTALALNIASNVVLSPNKAKPVLFFSLEMSAQSIMQRLISTHARVDLMKVRTGFFEKKNWTHLTNAASRFGEAPLYIVDNPSLNVLNVRSYSRQLASELRGKKTELGLIIVDYLQLLRGTGGRENRQQEVSEISRGLKALARDLNVPVIALSQLSRRTEEKGRSDARPQLSDLRESGALEQDADLVAFLYRESYYKPNDPSIDERKAEIIISKQRQGPVGRVEVFFYRHFTLFQDAIEEGAEEMEEAAVI